MKRFVVFSLVLGLLSSAVPAHADPPSKTLTGALLLVGAGGLTAAAFNYSSSCPTGYTTHTFENYDGTHETWCVSINSYGSDVRREPTTASLERPALLYAAGGAAAAGIVLLMLPKNKATNNVTASVQPHAWKVTKTVKW